MSGFTKSIRAELARSVVFYLEQEDPDRQHREKVVCAVNLGDFELNYPSTPNEPEKMTSDGRTVRRQMWDEAVRALTLILSENNLNPRFVRNDKNKCRLQIKQDSVDSPDKIPDEFYSMELYYLSEFELETKKLEYVKKSHRYEERITDIRSMISSWVTPKSRKVELTQHLDILEKERAFFLGTTPDPREMDSGLIFKIEVYTSKEWGVMKDKMKIILNHYVEELSRVAAAHGTEISSTLKAGALRELKSA